MRKDESVRRMLAIALVFVMIGGVFGWLPGSVSQVEASPAIIYVPDDYATVQAAVDAANSGDTIIVRDGIYTENVTIATDNLTVMSENGADSTFVQAANPDDHVFAVTADHVNISGFAVTGHGYGGIYLSGSFEDHVQYCTISANVVTGKTYGISLMYASDNVLTANVASSNHRAIRLLVSPNNTLSNNAVSNNTEGIKIHLSPDNALTDNTMTDNSRNLDIFGVGHGEFVQSIDTSNTINGMPVQYLVDKEDMIVDSSWEVGYLGIVNCSNMTVTDLTLTNNGQGVLLAHSSDSRIENVNVVNNYHGVLVSSSSNNVLEGNLVSSNNHGVYLFASTNNTLAANAVDSNFYGLWLSASPSTLTNNNLSNNNRSLIVKGSDLPDYRSSIDTSNKINGKPIYYLVDEEGLVIDSSQDVGYLGLINCNNMLVKDLSFANNGQGLLLAYTSNSEIRSINAYDNRHGIYLWQSSGNTIRDSDLSNNAYYGIRLYRSSSNTLVNNRASGCFPGVGLYDSSSNIIYLNDFVENVTSIRSAGSTNSWSSPEPMTYAYGGNVYTGFLGNYMSDYTGSDTDGDGIGDTPYVIDSEADSHPLVEPFEHYVVEEGQVVTFPDPNLEAAIREAIAKPEGDIHRSDLEGLTTLSASNRGISDLTGLEYCINLTWLRLQSNQISDISPLANLTILTDLLLGVNQISNISSLAGLTSLTRLFLQWNEISDISPLEGLTSLTYLPLSNNKISDISPLEGLTNLTYLYLSSNQISDISPLEGLTSLTELFLGVNQIGDISSMAGLTSLTSLSLEWNKMSDISPLEGLTSLTLLNLAYNQISDISPLAGLTSLTSLSLGGNQISDISPLEELTNLASLHLWSNQISDLSPLASLAELRHLDLHGNQISDLSPLAGLTNLTGLYLWSNQISDISPLESLTDLEFLHLDDNEIVSLEPLSGLTKLGESEYPGTIRGMEWDREGVRVHLGLRNNQIDHLSPLVQNEGLGEGDGIDLRGNPLSPESLTVHIPQLEERGVAVLHDPLGLAIVTTELPSGHFGVTYEATLEGTGGTKPYTWDIVAVELPDGLELDTDTGVISGTPTRAETFLFTVRVTDDEGLTATKVLSITVSAAEHVEFTYDLKAGWNMVSLPLHGLETSPAVLFPGHVAIYTWNADELRYEVPAELVPGRGYWILYFDDASVEIHGTPVEHYEHVDAVAGWHLIGSLWVDAQVTVSAGSVYRLLYWWNPQVLTYEATETLEPGKGYWLLGFTPFTIWVGTPYEVVYYDTTKVITEGEAENITALTDERDRILFGELTDFVAGIQVGDVLVSEHPVPGAEHGFLKRVVGVTPLAGTLDEGGAVEIEVEPATLEDVIERGVIEASGTISAETLLSGVVWAEGVEITQVEGEYQFSYEPMEGVTIEGYLRVTADADVYISASIWSGLQEFVFTFSPGLGMEATLTVEQDVNWSGEVIIGTITGPPIPIWGPVTITPKMDLVVGTAGQIAATLEAAVTYERGYDVGIRYCGGEWSTFSEIWGEGATLDEPTFSGQAEARVFGGAILSGKAGVSYMAEATLRAEVLGNVRASGEMENSPWRWQYDLELYLTAQVFADLELCRIAKVSWESPTWEYPAHPNPRYNLAYGASGRVTNEDDEGLEGVTINFSGGHSSVTTDADGYWPKHLLRGEVTATPEKAGYVFDPPNVNIAGSASNLNFQANEGVTRLEIRDWHDLDAVRDNLSGDYTLMNDLDSSTLGYDALASPTANEGKGWDPLGRFQGTFDGQGYEIRDLCVDRPDEEPLGLFGLVDHVGVVQGVGVVNVAVAGRYRVGGLVGENRGTVSNSYSSGNVAGTSSVGGLVGLNWQGTVSSSQSTASVGASVGGGGLVGDNYGSVSDSHATGPVTGGWDASGGLVGYNYGSVSDSYATGAVTGGTVGGLVGSNSGFVSNSYSTGSVSTSGETDDDWYAGGLTGWNSGTVSDSYSTSSVIGDYAVGGLVGINYGDGVVTLSYATGIVIGKDRVGGLVGWNYGEMGHASVSHSYSSGSVNANNYVGGLVGLNDGRYYDASVSQSYSTGSVTGDSRVGGLVGLNSADAGDATVSYSYSIGTVSGSSWVGGLLGRNYLGNVSNSFWDVQTSGIGVSDGGTGKTTVEMMDIATFTDTATEGLVEPWDMIAVSPSETSRAYTWNIIDGETYPFLSWQADEEEEPDEFTLTITSTEGGSVTEPGEGTFTRDAGTVVSLVAAPATGYQFVNWTGDVGTVANVNAASTTVTMNGNYSIKANFEEIPTVQYDLTISSTAGGSVTTPGEGIYTYDAGIVVNLVAEAEEGYRFVNWTGDVGTVGNVDTAATTITMNDNYSITANFEANEPPWLLITVHPWDYATPIEDIVDQGGSWHNSDFTRHIYAYDPDGTVVSYEYFVYDNIGHTVISSGTGDVSWDGSYYWVASQTFAVGEDGDFSVQGKNASTLYVRVEDNEGAVSEWATVTYNIDWTPPSVGIVSPTTATAGVPEVFSATVSDNVELNYAFLYVDGSYVGSMTLDPSPVPGGESGTASMEYAFALPGTYTMYVRCADHYDPESETYLNLASGSPVAVEVSEATDPEVTFPDANLEAAIREAIGKPTGDIYPSDLEKLTYLDASDRSITELTGLEYCSDLTVLCLFHNQISDISPLAGLTSLTDLHLWANQISNISPLAGLTSLTRLYLGSNQISDISPVAGLTSLTYLDLGGNQISDVSPLAGLTSLTNLYLWNNQVSDISPLTGLTSLTGLDLKWNQISDISPLAGLTSLTDLHLWANQISDISPLAGLTSLTYLDLGINQISDISPLAGLTSLPHLELGRNQISDISPLAGLTSLTNLRLYENQISDISPLAGLTSLTRLRLWDNQISDISPLAGLTGLTWLSLGGNQISDISPLAGLTSLLLLSLGSNQISDISPLAGLTSLTYLYLYSNQISDIAPLVDNTGLGEGDEVDLQDNPLSDDSINIYIPELEARGVKVQY